jgi:hypothetical protein
MTDIPTLVEVVNRRGEVRWHLLGSFGRQVLRTPYARFEDACQGAGEVAAFFQRVPYPAPAPEQEEAR